MRGVRYLVDENGKRKAVQIDLSAWGRLWEDFQDVLVSESRKHEPGIPWKVLKSEMEQEGGEPA